MKKFACMFVLSAIASFAPLAHAGGLFGLDRYDEREDSGIFSRSNQKALDVLLLTGVLGTALWEGTDSTLGKASWQAIDATLATAVTTEAMKRVFRRPRPAQDPNPDHWFRSSNDHSFPSGEVAMVASIVTPYIYAYHEEHPAVWALASLPAYMAYARMSSQAHWLSDVLAGGLIGAGLGYWASRREQPLILVVTGRGAFVGWHAKF
jgi:membrane-associated phospholipid phosphatase